MYIELVQCVFSVHVCKYIRFSLFRDISFYDDSLLRHLSSLTEHSGLAVHHCCNSIVLSVFSSLLALSGEHVFLVFQF